MKVPVAILALFIGVSAYVGIQWENAHHVYANCHVTGKDRTSTQNGSNMRVYTSCGVFQVADDMIQGKWNSADTYAKISVGKTYSFKTVGWRNGFFSAFPNILEAN